MYDFQYSIFFNACCIQYMPLLRLELTALALYGVRVTNHPALHLCRSPLPLTLTAFFLSLIIEKRKIFLEDFPRLKV